MGHPFDAQEIYNQQRRLTRDQVEMVLAKADYLRTVRESGHNHRARYEYRKECRSYGPVTYAAGRRTCAECRRTIEPGEPIYNPRKRSGTARHEWLCKECGLKAIALAVERLLNME